MNEGPNWKVIQIYWNNVTCRWQELMTLVEIGFYFYDFSIIYSDLVYMVKFRYTYASIKDHIFNKLIIY